MASRIKCRSAASGTGLADHGRAQAGAGLHHGAQAQAIAPQRQMIAAEGHSQGLFHACGPFIGSGTTHIDKKLTYIMVFPGGAD